MSSPIPFSSSPSGKLHVLMIALGSAGDVHPFAGLGHALLEHGHRVELVTNPHFEKLVDNLGLNFLPVGTEKEFIDATLDERLWHQTEGFKLTARYLMLAQMRSIYAMVMERYQPGKTIVVAPFSAFGARLAQEKHGVPLVSVHLQPSLMRSVHDAPVFPFPEFITSRPSLARACHSFAFKTIDRWLLEPALVPGLNEYRAELGLPPEEGILARWVHSPELVIGLFPDWFGCPQPDWPPNVHLTGFPLFDESQTRDPSSDLEEFLAAGEPPIVYTAGSAMRQAPGFFRAAAGACELLGRRGALVTRYPEQLPDTLPAGVRHFDYIPFSEILPRAAAFVHHGGIGTIAQAFAAGVPQLVTPYSHDQPDNAERVRRLGAGYKTNPKGLSARRLAKHLERLLESKEIVARCRELAEITDRRYAIDEACRLIEEMGARHAGEVATAGSGQVR